MESFKPGQRVVHSEFGEGVVIALISGGYLQVFFPSGERRVHENAVLPALSRTHRVIANVEGSSDRLRTAWLHYESFALPLLENATALQSIFFPIRL